MSSEAGPISGSRSRARRILDALVGIALPIALLVFDPIFFRGSYYWAGSAPLSEYRGACYVMAGCCITTLAAWLCVRRWPATCSGVLWLGALFAASMGVLLVVSAPELLLCMGLFALLPIWIAFVYWRNAMEAARQSGDVPRALTGVTLVLVAGMGTQLATSWAVERGIARALSGDAGEQEAGTELLRRVLRLHDMEQLAELYWREEDPVRKKRINQVYRHVTGINVDQDS